VNTAAASGVSRFLTKKSESVGKHPKVGGEKVENRQGGRFHLQFFKIVLWKSSENARLLNTECTQDVHAKKSHYSGVVFANQRKPLMGKVLRSFLSQYYVLVAPCLQ
jgi:hypothetical protein